MHDPLNVADLVHYELAERRESGYDVKSLRAEVAEAPAEDVDRLEAIYAELIQTPRNPGWTYDEPESLMEILSAMPGSDESRPTPPAERLADRVLGGWQGRIAGCNLGKPVEDGDFWTPERLRSYLELAGAYPLRDYIPVLDPMPAEYRLRECWPETTRGRVAGSARDDDIDYSILGLWLLEQYGLGLSPSMVASAFLSFLPVLRVFTAERAAVVNLLHKVPTENVAEVRNPYREWIGALIRADVFGWVLPGRPLTAARLAYCDASLTHRANGIYAAMWSAALVSLASTAGSVQEAFTESLGYVPARSRLAEALHMVHQMHRSGCTWDEAIQAIRSRFGHYSWVHSVNNACLIAAGLLWGDGDYAATVGLTVQGGWDTDSNAATAGSVAGTVLGAGALPAHLVEPLQDRTRSAVFGYDNARISDLARRTVRLAEGGLRPGAGCA